MSDLYESTPASTTTDLADAYKTAALVINADQANALVALLWEGRLKGTRYHDVEPPRTAALIPLGDREALGLPLPLRDRKNGAPPPDPTTTGTRPWVHPMPASHTVGVIASDGRCWELSRAGVCWPIPLPPESEGRTDGAP